MAFQALKLACSGQQLFIPWANLPKSPMVTLNPEHSPPWGRRIGGCAHEVVQHAFSRGALFRALCFVFFLREVKSWSVLLRLRQFGSQVKLLPGTICIGMTSGGPSSEAVPRTYPQWTDRFMGKKRVNRWT